MGVDYRVWIIPKQRAHRPDAEQLASLANQLREGGWVPRPEAAGHNSEARELLPSGASAGKKPARATEFPSTPFTPGWVEYHSDHELVLEWYVNDTRMAGVQFPFVFIPYPESPFTYFCIRLILGKDYFCWTGENVMPFDKDQTRCTCTQQLGYDTGWSRGAPFGRIHHICPACGQFFDPSAISCDLLDGWTGASASLQGGLVFRFALVVDCHKNWPREEAEGRRFHLRSEFLNLWRTHIGVSFDTVVTFD